MWCSQLQEAKARIQRIWDGRCNILFPETCRVGSIFQMTTVATERTDKSGATLLLLSCNRMVVGRRLPLCRKRKVCIVLLNAF